MRKGLIFTITTIIIFLPVLVSSVQIRFRFIDQSRFINLRIPGSIDNNLFDDLSFDIQEIMKVSIDNTLNLTINDSLPYNLTKKFNNYQLFLDNVVNEVTNSNYSINYNENKLTAQDLMNYEYDDNKTFINVTLINESVNYFKIIIKSSNELSSSLNNWNWVASGVFVEIRLIDSNNETLIINGQTSGHLNPNITHSVSVSYTNGGKLNIVFDNAPYINVSGTSINTSITFDRKATDLRTGYLININNSILKLSKNDFSVIN